MSNIVINLAAEYTGNKAFKKAGKDVTSLEKSVKKLGKSLGIALSTAAVVAFGKASVKAFAEDERSAVMLANAVKNLGYEMSAPSIENFIQNLSKSAHIADDQLRPAMQKLLTTTGSLSKSQELLNNAVEISRGSGVDLATVAEDLSNAYVGNTKGLKKYYLGLSQAQLKGMSFLEIQTKLNKQFSGANAKYLETYAGKIEAITVASGEAKETIGKGLVDALTLAGGGSKDIDSVTTAMQGLADYTANAVRGIGVLAGELSKLDQNTGGILSKLFKEGSKTGLLYWIAQLGKNAAPKDTGMYADPRYQQYAAIQAKKKEAELAKKAADEQKKLLAKQQAAQKALLAEQKKQLALKKAASIFDMEQIQIIAALKGNISNEERKRLELQLALATGNVDEAQKLTYQLAIAQGLSVKLAQELASLPAASNPFAAWKGYLDEIELQAKRISGMGGTSTPTANTPTDWSNFVGLATQGYSGTGTGQGGSVMDNYRAQQAPIVVQIDGKTIATAMQDQSLSGIQAKVNRAMGGFDW